MTALLGLFAVYIFSLVGFYAFPHDFYSEAISGDECETMIMCFTTFLYNGLLSGGGIADYMSYELGWGPQVSCVRVRLAPIVAAHRLLLRTANTRTCAPVSTSRTCTQASGLEFQNTGLMFARTVFDLMFFIIVLVLLLNIIFGIILDTFSDLREKAKEQNEDMTR
jgi:hypothetical protein